MQRWTEEEDKYLLVTHEKWDLSFVSSVLNRPPSEVEDRIKSLRKKQIEVPKEMGYFLERAERINGVISPRKIKGTVDTTPKLKPYTGRGSAWAHTNTGYRHDIKINARSNWEANFARILNLYDIAWEFEPRVFTYPVKRGTKGYTPDFYFNDTEEWVELKGYLDSKSQIKLKRFKRYYPDEFERMTMVISRSSRIARTFCENLEVPTVLYYEELGKIFKDRIPTWEGK